MAFFIYRPMIYLKTFNEAKSKSYYYKVVIVWEHGDADKKTIETYPFEKEEEMQNFLQFIFDIRKFIPNSGWENAGHFLDGHYERERKWIDKIDQKYGNKFGSMIPNDIHYKSTDYTPRVNSIHVEIDGVVHNIIWEKALKLTNKIDLPKIGTEITVSIGHISGHGPTIFGGTTNDYFYYEDFEHKNIEMSEGQYIDIKATIVDTKIYNYKPYESFLSYELINNKEVVKGRYYTYSDYEFFQYVQLLKFDPSGFNKFITTEMVGYDPKYSDKFHYPEYGTNDFYLVN